MSFQACIYICLVKIEALCTKNKGFHQPYLNADSKTQNVEKLSLDLIFRNKFINQNSKLRIHYKPDINQSKLTVCNMLLLNKSYLIKDILGFFKPLGIFDISSSRSRLIPAIVFFLCKKIFPFKLMKLKPYKSTYTF